MMTVRPVLGSIVIANYITVTTNSKTSIQVKAKIFFMLSQEVHNKMPMLPSEVTQLMTDRIL